MTRRRALREWTAVSTVVALLLTCSPPAARAQLESAQMPEAPIEIAHDPLACMTPVLAPEVDAGVTPATDYEKGYVYFRAAGTDDYYYVKMEGPPTTLAGVLPRPLPETKAVDYFLRAYDLRQASKRKGDWTPPVVPGTTCKAKGVVVGPQGAGLTVGLMREGQNPHPPGFDKRDIARVILVTGAIVTIAQALKTGGASSGGASAGAASAGAAGGLSTVAIVAGAAAVAGAGIAIASANDDEPNPTSTPLPTSTPTPTPTVAPLRFVQADASWSGTGDVDVQILNPSGQAVGQTIPAGCESTANRTERVILQGVLPSGTYRVVLTGRSCGAGTPSTISAIASVQTDAGERCPSTFVNVPVPGTVTACQFNIP
ncbi:MAG TPA: hypothetical protein VFF17_13965 [Thermoanaerobaculia bacterium]|nr:hypothetical protein [Thermoanaerobaculia bacterium]